MGRKPLDQKTIKKKLEDYIEVEFFCGEPSDIITRINNLKRKWIDKGWFNIEFQVGDWETTTFVVLGERYETDKERMRRLAREKKTREKKKSKKEEQDATERKELVRLLNKHGIPPESEGVDHEALINQADPFMGRKND